MKKKWATRSIARSQAYKAWAKRNPGKIATNYKAWYAKVKDTKKFKARCFARWLVRIYGPGAVEHYFASKKRQKGRCNICKKKRKLIFEHCHKTGKWRKLTCSPCNLALGAFNDDPKLLTRAIAHLKGK